jgi:acyl-CoA thioester hydrolase
MQAPPTPGRPRPITFDRRADDSSREDAFLWRVRVYFEDTDAGGIVYYANFLKFFERSRTEWLRAAGFNQQELVRRGGVQFVVTAAQVEYRRPARLDDELVIESRIEQARHVTLVFAQRALRGTEELARAKVTIAAVSVGGKNGLSAARLPDGLLAAATAAAAAARAV